MSSMTTVYEDWKKDKGSRLIWSARRYYEAVESSLKRDVKEGKHPERKHRTLDEFLK